MTRRLHYLFVFLLLSAGHVAWAQQSGAIVGKVLDEKGQPAFGAVVQVLEGGISKGGAQIFEEDGSFTVKPLSAGRYTVQVSNIGYKTAVTNNVLVSADKNTEVNFTLEASSATELVEFVVKEYKVPLVDKYQPGSTTTLTSEQIEKMPTRNTNDFASTSTGTYQAKSGANVSIGGARTDGTLYIIDGIQVRGVSGTNFPPGAIDQIQVITSGIPARYGDASGGVINITTKGPSSEFRGNANFEHSVEGYNRNLAFFNVSGPLLKKSVDTGGKLKKTVLGFSLSGQYLYEPDNDPTYYDNYVVKDDVLQRLRQNPLIPTINSAGVQTYRYATEYITYNDLTTQKRRVNADYTNYRGNTRIDYQLSDNMNISVGGNLSYIRSKNYRRGLSLFAPEAMPVDNLLTGRAFVRFTQRFGKSNMTAEEAATHKAPLISNAYYSVQADYQVDYTSRQDPNHKRDPFRYGYIGKFTQQYSPIYFPLKDDSTGKTLVTLISRYRQTALDFNRSEINPFLANYTSVYYNSLNGDLPTSNAFVRGGNGLLNGDQPLATHGLWSNVGTGFSGYTYSNAEQFALDVNASFDFQPKKTKHAIEFGLYYQQRAERAYSNNATSLWGQMRLLANRHLNDLDKSTPIYIKNGQQYSLADVRNGVVNIGPADTVIYNQFVDPTLQSTFDRNLRTKLGLNPNGTDRIDPDALDPSTFSMSMFSPDEILNSGNPIATYYGYDYTGKRLTGQVNFNDWFLKKDANGNYTRQIGAFRPNYIAGYIQDRFQYKDVLFNLGVRVERFDANTKVLKDPYSLYAVQTVGQSNAVNNFNSGKTPENIKNNYVVYVNSNSGTPSVVGYRNGDDWYDPYGRLVQDPQRLKDYNDGGDPQPHLQVNGPNNTSLTMRDSLYDPNSSFTDYKPQVNVMPRISFSFPIADKALFYAHYDILVQRPKNVGDIYATAADYYYLQQNAQQLVANPDLKPEKTYDYELGFTQQIGNAAAVTINGFYKERKDMIQARPYLYAYPTTYFTLGNRDFSTTKGVSLKYDLRRTNNLSLNFAYTLQFVEGSGFSTTESARGGLTAGLLGNFITSGLPNIRFAYPLAVDSRHILNMSLDYRYADGEGPVIGGKHIFQNAGINLLARARSGEPYTRYAIVNSQTVQGGVNSSRLPWHYMVDMRVDKDFSFNFGKKDANTNRRRSLDLQAFVYVQNLFNIRDVLGVNGFTNKPDDNGYLTAPQGQIYLNSLPSGIRQSYFDLYSISSNGVGNFNNPRRINVGLGLNF